MTFGGTLGTLWGAIKQRAVSHVKGKCPTHCTVSLVPFLALLSLTQAPSPTVGKFTSAGKSQWVVLIRYCLFCYFNLLYTTY